MKEDPLPVTQCGWLRAHKAHGEVDIKSSSVYMYNL